MINKYEIWTDGGARGNGKEDSIGAFGVVVVYPDGSTKEIANGKKGTTNNEMELCGVAVGVKIAKQIIDSLGDCIVEIHCDSAYAVNTVNDWMWKWAGNGWTKKGGDIKNLKLIQSIYDELNFYPQSNRIKLIKCKGHAGLKYNERADKILNEYMDRNL